MIEIQNEYRKNLSRFALIFLIIVSVYFVVKVFSEWRSYDLMGNQANTITLSGHGEVNAVPDIATIYFTALSSKNTQKDASDEVNTKMKQILDFLKSSEVDEKDIKTENYNSYPKYSNPSPCPVYYGERDLMMPCIQSESKIIGYTVSQGVTVKVRKVDDASIIIDGINKIGVTNMSGPNLAIDDEDELKVEARKLAINDAKKKAKVLSKDLGVRLGKIMSFSENGNYPMPMYYAKDMALSSVGESAPAQLPKGENTISSDVSITYQIR